MKKSVDKRVRRTKKNFKSALLSLLKMKHFDDITITDLVTKADYNRGTFYVHYERKEDLLDEIIDEMLAELLKSIRKAYFKLKNEVAITDLTIITMFDHFLENKDFYQLMLGPNIQTDFPGKLVRLLKQHFREDIDFITDEQVDIELFYSFRVHAMIGLILEWIATDFQLSKEYMAEQMIKIASLQTKKVYVKLN